MIFRNSVCFLATLLGAAFLFLVQPLAQAVPEKEAFEAAKELGTIEAWEAFLNNFPKGFRADLARAYVRRLGNDNRPAPAQAEQAPAQSAPAPQPVAQPPVAPPPPQPQLQPIHLGPDSTPWANGTYALDEGNSSAYAAIVHSSGLQFTAYCSANRQFATVLGEANRGVYPEFDQRVAQGLEASRGNYGTNDTRFSIHLDNGSEHILPANVMGLTGEVMISSDGQGTGFTPGSTFINDMMSANSMTFSAPPFGVTFQLTNSRLALCNVLKQCGVSAPGCARYQPRPVSVQTAPAPKKPKVVKKKPKGCPGGTVFLEGKCIPQSQVTSYCGPGYTRKGSKCVLRSNAQAPAQQPQQQQNAPSAVQILQGLAGAIQQQQQQNNNRRCPPGKVWEVNSCVEDD